MRVMEITPHKLQGRLEAMPSKSGSHRALICAALARGESVIEGLQFSDDVEATLDAVKAMGLASWTKLDGQVSVRGMQTGAAEAGQIDCRESGSTLRFLLPVSLLSGGGTFTGQGRLMQRPLAPYRALFEEKGIAWQESGGAVSVSGTLVPGRYALAGNVSSQFVSGLLYCLPLLQNDSQIELTTQVESEGYIELTRQMQARFGVRSDWADARTLIVPGGQRYTPARIKIEGDWSHAAFYVAAGAMGGALTLCGLDDGSAQADRAIDGLAKGMGAAVSWEGSALRVCGGTLCGAVIDVSQTPDLVPALCALACAADGQTRLMNAARLRAKESDRLSALCREFTAIGADIEETADSLIIRGHGRLSGGACNAQNDHRIAMALAVASAICDNPINLSGFDCVKKSAPRFWEEYQSLGGVICERDMGQAF